MPAKKIQDEGEVVRWFEQGWTYDEMVDEYRRKYHIEIQPSAFGNFRRRKGLSRRITRDDELIPWYVKPEHRWAYPAAMLRAEARARAGKVLKPGEAERLSSWRERLDENNAVVHYDEDTEQGWYYVPRREGIDRDLIREPDRKTTQRRAAD